MDHGKDESPFVTVYYQDLDGKMRFDAWWQAMVPERDDNKPVWGHGEVIRARLATWRDWLDPQRPYTQLPRQIAQELLAEQSDFALIDMVEASDDYLASLVALGRIPPAVLRKFRDVLAL